MDYLKIIVTIVLAVVGWRVGYSLTIKKDIIQKRRDISIEHLINAYRILTTEVAHREMTNENKMKLENILSDIQLFGSDEQIQFAKKLTEIVAAGDAFLLDPLINSLRNDLREMIGLKRITENVNYLRFRDE